MTPLHLAVSRLETDRLILRAPQAGDIVAFVAFYGSARRAETAHIVPADVARQRFADVCTHWQTKGYGRFIVADKNTGQTLGMVGPHHPDDYPEAEICWHLWTADAEGKGIAFEAAQASLHHAFHTLKWQTAVSCIYKDNSRSLRLAEKLGAVPDLKASHPAAIGPHLVYRHSPSEAPRHA